MVIVPKYYCGFGNMMGQYFWPRIIAQALGYRFQAPALLRLETNIAGEEYESPVHHVSDFAGRAVEPQSVLGRTDHRKIIMEGFFQQADKYVEHRDLIRGWAQSSLPAMHCRQGDWVAVHIRLGDYLLYGWQLPVAYYIRALELANSALGSIRCIVFSDDSGLKLAPYLEAISKRCVEVTLCSDSIEMAFRSIMGCPAIICGNSTFSWWAAFLSRAEHVWMPHNWQPWGRAQHSDALLGAGKIYPTDLRYHGAGWRIIDMEEKNDEQDNSRIHLG